VIVTEEDSTLLAYAVVTWGWSIESGGRDALLDEIYVADRSRGIGAEMMHEIMERVAGGRLSKDVPRDGVSQSGGADLLHPPRIRHR
jgi:hypothetical protein